MVPVFYSAGQSKFKSLNLKKNDFNSRIAMNNRNSQEVAHSRISRFTNSRNVFLFIIFASYAFTAGGAGSLEQASL